MYESMSVVSYMYQSSHSEGFLGLLFPSQMYISFAAFSRCIAVSVDKRKRRRGGREKESQHVAIWVSRYVMRDSQKMSTSHLFPLLV